MKPKISRQLQSPTGDATKDIIYVNSVMQDITDDLSLSLSGGLSIKDNLPLSLYSKTITSGVAFETQGYGAIVTFTSKPIKSIIHKQLRSNQLQVTITTEDGSPSDVILLLIKETP